MSVNSRIFKAPPTSVLGMLINPKPRSAYKALSLGALGWVPEAQKYGIGLSTRTFCVESVESAFKALEDYAWANRREFIITFTHEIDGVTHVGAVSLDMPHPVNFTPTWINAAKK